MQPDVENHSPHPAGRGGLSAHQDFWNWKKIKPLVLSFLPIGLAYHVGYSLVAALTMLVLVKFAWPKQLDADEKSAPRRAEDAR